MKIQELRQLMSAADRECLDIQQEVVLFKALKTSDVKYMAIEELCSMVLLLTIALAELETGVKYFYEHSKNMDREITLYHALELVEWVGTDKLWIEVYRYGLAQKIVPRSNLQEQYKKKQERGNFGGIIDDCFFALAYT
ncbi:MAG: hypothetical protein NC245_01175 [Muribaculum sp.]|nr:hypothetical protein [Muribaculum sp.]